MNHSGTHSLTRAFYLPTDNGQIDFREFAVLMRDRFGVIEYQEMAVREAFQLLDRDGNGYIDYDELRAVLLDKGETLTEEEFQRVIEELDANKDGRIEYEGEAAVYVDPPLWQDRVRR